MQMTPVAKRHNIDTFLLRGIWRFHVSHIGSAMTTQVVSEKMIPELKERVA
jgi:hypothetical protein